MPVVSNAYVSSALDTALLLKIIAIADNGTPRGLAPGRPVSLPVTSCTHRSHSWASFSSCIRTSEQACRGVMLARGPSTGEREAGQPVSGGGKGGGGGPHGRRRPSAGEALKHLLSPGGSRGGLPPPGAPFLLGMDGGQPMVLTESDIEDDENMKQVHTWREQGSSSIRRRGRRLPGRTRHAFLLRASQSAGGQCCLAG